MRGDTTKTAQFAAIKRGSTKRIQKVQEKLKSQGLISDVQERSSSEDEEDQLSEDIEELDSDKNEEAKLSSSDAEGSAKEQRK